jgi:hypothetical protein
VELDIVLAFSVCHAVNAISALARLSGKESRNMEHRAIDLNVGVVY